MSMNMVCLSTYLDHLFLPSSFQHASPAYAFMLKYYFLFRSLDSGQYSNSIGYSTAFLGRSHRGKLPSSYQTTHSRNIAASEGSCSQELRPLVQTPSYTPTFLVQVPSWEAYNLGPWVRPFFGTFAKTSLSEQVGEVVELFLHLDSVFS